MLFKRLIFWGMNFFSSSLTLSSRTWREIKSDELLRDLYKSKRSEERQMRRNSTPFAMFFILLLLSAGFAFCFTPRDCIDKWSGFLGFLKFTKDDSKELISDILASSATIIGLSFVVIGFSFEVVKNASSQTLGTIFRETKLHFVFAISILSILFLVLMTALKHSMSEYIVGNFAIFSCWLLISTTVAIAYMFAKVITFFNQEKISRMSREYLSRLSTYAILEFEYKRLSKELYDSYFLSRGFRRYFNFTGARYDTVIRYRNKKNEEFVDACLPLMASVVEKIGKRLGNQMPDYELFGHKSLLGPNQGLFYFNSSSRLRWIEGKLVNFCVHTKQSSYLLEEFSQKKEEMQESLIIAAKDGDMKQLRSRLEDMRRLHENFRS